MGSPLGDDIIGDGVGSGQQEPQGSPVGGHPAWNEYLSGIPQEFHDKVTPAFQKWDTEVQGKLQKVHSTYEPWKPFMDAGIDPQQAEMALQIYNSINETPEMVHKAIEEYFGPFGTQEPEGEQGQNGEQSDPYESRFTEIERQNRIMAQALLEARDSESQAQADAQLDAEMGQVYEKYGQLNPISEKMILGLMNSDGNLTANQAADLYFQNLESVSKARVPKPLIMGAGGGAPGTGVDVKKLDDKGTKDLVVQMLQAAADQRQ